MVLTVLKFLEIQSLIRFHRLGKIRWFKRYHAWGSSLTELSGPVWLAQMRYWVDSEPDLVIVILNRGIFLSFHHKIWYSLVNDLGKLFY